MAILSSPGATTDMASPGQSIKQMPMQFTGRKTEAIPGQQGNDFIQSTPQLRNSMRDHNQVQMKTYE